MKKHILKKSFLAVTVLLVSAVSYAQSSSSGYFVEGFSPRYQLNPAFSPEKKVFVAIPVLSNYYVDLQSNVGISNFLFESSKSAKLMTFMSSDVSYDKFMDALPKESKINSEVSMDILGVGVGNKKWFTTFNVRVRNNENVSIPKDFFGFMKSGLAKGDYLIEDIRIQSQTYMEWSLTHSHKIGDNLTIGAGLKLVQGLEYADVKIEQIDARLADDEWKVMTNGVLKASVPATEIKYDAVNHRIDGIENGSFKMPTSFGFAVDLGAEYDMQDLVQGLKVSASVTDLGVVNWTQLQSYETDNKEYVSFKGFKDYKIGGKDNKALDDLKDDFNDMIRVYQTAEDGKESKALDATLRLGASYDMPMVSWLSFGQLFTYKTGLYSYFESRTSVRLSPCDWFDATGNVAVSNYGPAMGLLLNLHPGGVNFFLSVDKIKGELNRQALPLNDFGLTFSLGLSLAIGDKD